MLACGEAHNFDYLLTLVDACDRYRVANIKDVYVLLLYMYIVSMYNYLYNIKAYLNKIGSNKASMCSS